ncbi:hypothetical protein POM88_031869 [Heracleum sosnowskyi]|uniref:Uncharacterized protein n=1 Tax=Heracleum sosnowskyi TaxID=360622 RepID=A0AAD8MJH6_9APIA|nr:hypothetical protein POM88_031869 [Heracleum sosnowskyi]
MDSKTITRFLSLEQLSKEQLNSFKTGKEDVDMIDVEPEQDGKPGDLLEGQRQYNSVIHSIQEKAHLAYGISNYVKSNAILKAAYTVGGKYINADIIQSSILGIRSHYTAPIALGDAISPVSSYNGAQFDISILLWKARSAFTGIMDGFTIAIMLIALFGTVLLWMYESVLTTAFFASCGGMTFVFSHGRFDVIPPGGCFDGVSSHSSKNENVGGKEGSSDK